jgi:hypothetical protein
LILVWAFPVWKARLLKGTAVDDYILESERVSWDLDGAEADEAVRDEADRQVCFEGDDATDEPPVSSKEDVARMRAQLGLGVEGEGRSFDALIRAMPSSRTMFWKLLVFCTEARSTHEVEAFVGDLQANHRSVFCAADYCRMLEECGCMREVDADGSPFDISQAEPESVVVDGSPCLIAGAPPEAFWVTTGEGARVCEGIRPLDELLARIEENGRFREVYAKILSMTSAPDGASIAAIKGDVNAMPVLEFPAKTAQLFIGELERFQAIAWKDTWKITEIGREALSRIGGSSASDGKQRIA